ncbi:cytochrome P450 monooxygenase-like protein [Lophiostoma macrostomum CBS 122681]|uniref:Cytochrome P450 monooxygenase-like protein n=1 Tax=Lophiostoma macrostomum CBS 122681 TaxID=1314788 RepID=A0A6A6TMK4_9PLEO|nr:cytochrome P450 monooxygenase-like protein [Lophiostoma macrostomum CBS 122681]
MSMHWFGPKAPSFGQTSVFQSRYLVNWNFFRQAGFILDAGYAKFSDRAWKLNRADTDLLLLPPRYVDELRSLTSDVASPTAAHSFNLCGSQTNMNIILKNNLHFRTLQEKLTPNLARLSFPMQDELDLAMREELPICNDWTPIKPYHTILRLVARVSARVFLGLPLCRSEEWLEISTEFTENTFITLVVLRLFPQFLHRPIAWLLPSAWRATNYIRKAKKLLVPEIKRRKASANASSAKRENSLNLLSWMMEIATPEESRPQDLAHLEVVISLASIHTSQMNAVHILYDLAERPEYIAILRDEIAANIQEDGPFLRWTKSSFSKLKKLDSFMRESQRVNPPTLLSYHRVMLKSFKLQDGTLLPRKSHIAMPVNAIQNAITPDADTFDPMRYYNLRQRENEGHLHQFATTEQNVLNFGHGKYACPGRFFAALEIKSILVRLIMEYDWKLPDGEARPENLKAHEFIFPNQEGVLYLKRRTDAVE